MGHIGNDSVIFCEAGEDIDYARKLIDAAGRDDPQAIRMLEQVKHRARGRLTLRSREVQQSLANYLRVRELNPGQRIDFRFFTNAIAVPEEKSPLPSGVPGINAWNAVRELRS